MITIDKLLVFKYIDKASMIIFIGVSSTYLLNQTYNITAPFLKTTNKSNYENTINLFKKEQKLHLSTVFVFDKLVKLIFQKNSILPNTEFYHVTRFNTGKSYNRLKKEEQIRYIILNDELIVENQFRALEIFEVDLTKKTFVKKIENYSIYELRK